MFSCERAQVVTDVFAGLEVEVTEAWLWHVLHTCPVWDDDTVYGTGILLAVLTGAHALSAFNDLTTVAQPPHQ